MQIRQAKDAVLVAMGQAKHFKLPAVQKQVLQTRFLLIVKEAVAQGGKYKKNELQQMVSRWYVSPDMVLEHYISVMLFPDNVG